MYEDRFLDSTYVDDQPVQFSVFARDVRVTSPVMLPESLFRRSQAIAHAYELHLLPSIDVYAETSLHKDQCMVLVDELRFVGAVVEDELLRKYLRPLVEILEVSMRQPGPVAVMIEGP
jgi:hypothetical protein